MMQAFVFLVCRLFNDFGDAATVSGAGVMGAGSSHHSEDHDDADSDDRFLHD